MIIVLSQIAFTYFLSYLIMQWKWRWQAVSAAGAGALDGAAVRLPGS